MKCNECKQELRYCCETTINEWRKRLPRPEYIALQDRYFACRSKYGFSIAEQRTQLIKQEYYCTLCRQAKRLVIDKQQAVEHHRLVFVCRSCQATIRRVKRFLDGQGHNHYIGVVDVLCLNWCCDNGVLLRDHKMNWYHRIKKDLTRRGYCVTIGLFDTSWRGMAVVIVACYVVLC